MRTALSPILLPVLGAALCASPAFGQLDFGSPEVSAEDMEEYAAPFYQLMAAPLGSHRMLPGARGWEVAVETSVIPIPDNDVFEGAQRSVWPVFRVAAGKHLGPASLGIRGMGWRDPRMGTVALGGANLGWLLPFGASRWSGALQGGWDHLYFTSSYDFEYTGSILAPGATVPGDYTLHEDAVGATAGALYRVGAWSLYSRSGPEWTLARLRYLYYPPNEPRRETRSRTGLLGWRTEIGGGWRGLRLEAGFLYTPYFNAGWAWNLM
jgi:hypothetical protein